MVTLYVDADDTILDSSKAVIEILNEKYNLSPAKTILDILSGTSKEVLSVKDLLTLKNDQRLSQRLFKL